MKTCVSAVVLLSLAGFTAPASAETLEEALVSAYSSNPTLMAERARLRATDEAVPTAQSGWRPEIKLTGDAGRAANSTNFFGPAMKKYDDSPRDYGATISEPLFRGGRTLAQTEQAEAQVKAERAVLDATEQSVLLAAITAYMNVVRDQAVLDLAINNEQVLQRQLDATNDRFRVGEVTRTDVAQSESRLSGAHADRTQAEGALRASTAAYVTTIGHAPAGLSDPPPVGNLPASLEDAKQAALAQNPTIKSAEYAYDAARHGIDAIAGELLPTVALTGSFTRSTDYQLTGIYFREALAAVTVSVPIYQQGQEYSRLRAQKHTAGQQQIDIDVSRRNVIEATTQAWEALQTAKARITSYDDQIKAAAVALEGVQRESEVGSRTVLDVLNAEQELLNAKVNLVQAKHDEVVAAYQVKSAIGRLNGKGLALPTGLYDPNKHYEEVKGKWFGWTIEPRYGESQK